MTLCCLSERELNASSRFCSRGESDSIAACLLGNRSALSERRSMASCIFAACCLMSKNTLSESMGSVSRLFCKRPMISAVTELDEPLATADSKDSRSSFGSLRVILAGSDLVSIIESMTPKRRKVLT